MSSRSIPRWLAVLATLVLWVGVAHAGKKRVVVLDFDGPKAEKFHEDVVKLLKKNFTVVSTEKWNGAAEELDAGKVTEKNVKKIAKKLKVDAVITGKIDKRRDEYIIKLKLRSGITGELTGTTVSTKADGPRLDGQAQRDIKDELLPVIEEMESRGGGGGDDEGSAGGEDDAFKKRKGGDAEDGEKHKSGFGKKDDEEGDKPKKSDDEDKPKKSDDEDKPKKKKTDDDEAAALSTKKSDDEDKPKKRKHSDDDEDKPKTKKRKASSEDEGGEGEGEGEGEEAASGDVELNHSVGHRAIDATVGLSFTARNLKFSYASDLGKVPPGYRQSLPVAGGLLDMTFYPLAFGHKKADITTNIGLNILYDQVIMINSRKRYLDGMGNPQTADLATKESRWSVGAVFRYPLNPNSPTSIVVGGSLSYGSQKFNVAQMLPNGGGATDIPNVAYTMFSPAAFVKFPLNTKINLNADFAFHAVTDTGEIQTSAQYGAATVTAYEVELGGDYLIKPSIFARASVRYEKIGMSFKGDPTSMTNTRDSDPAQDVTGASDTYFGATASVGYIY